jgi:hypothetical protein
MGPAVAGAEPSPLAIGQYVMLGADLVQGTGELPRLSAALPRTFDRRSAWVHLRFGVAESKGSTILGTQLGFEIDLRAGFTPSEAKEIHDPFPAGFEGTLGLSMRAFTFTVPLHGMIVPHVEAGLGAGGAHWWSDTARFSISGGLRVAVAAPGEVNLEVDYTIAPFTKTGSPRELEVQHLEHRLLVTLGGGPIGIGVFVAVTRDRWRDGPAGAYETAGGRAIGASLEWRPRWD